MQPILFSGAPPSLSHRSLFGIVSAVFFFGGLNFLGQFFQAGGWPAMATIIGKWTKKTKRRKRKGFRKSIVPRSLRRL